MAKKPEPPEPKQIQWQAAKGFKTSWTQVRSPALTEAMKTFNECKRENPPRALPRGMRDHKLSGALKEYRECHLDGDILLIYRPLANGAIKLMRVCNHDSIAGPRSQALADALKKE
jgi:mRNA interferase YafQ